MTFMSIYIQVGELFQTLFGRRDWWTDTGHNDAIDTFYFFKLKVLN
jgi:dTDP-glucose pyrophosphorylase